jgi:hypothetical protein
MYAYYIMYMYIIVTLTSSISDGYTHYGSNERK